jgi:gentisate 1,2-dioxygenase
MRDPARDDFYRRIADRHLTPLWEVLHGLVPRQPNTACAPAFWCYREIRSHLLEAGRLVTAAEAERRVLILENPAYPGESRLTNSLYGGLQLINPGEVARSHRHTQSALRFVMEGKGAFTAVDGEKAPMQRGDLILTPAWTWHDHGHEGHGPCIWFDALDIPLVRYLAAGFAEGAEFQSQPVQRPEGDSLARFGANMLPVDWQPQTQASPVFAYPYERSRAALARLAAAGPADPIHGVKMRYVNPANGGDALPTISAFLQLLPARFDGRWYRCTDAAVHIVVEGEGRTELEDGAFDWGPGDIFVVPNWARHRHTAGREAVLFSYSDRVIHQKLGLWREDRDPT